MADDDARAVRSCDATFFFFQAEDGIRDVAVTGVQTCALPISYAGFELRSIGRIREVERNRGVSVLAGRGIDRGDYRDVNGRRDRRAGSIQAKTEDRKSVV